MPKYKKGTVLQPKQYCQGFDRIVIDWAGTKYYHVKIMNGTATIPFHIVESNYEVVPRKKDTPLPADKAK